MARPIVTAPSENEAEYKRLPTNLFKKKLVKKAYGIQVLDSNKSLYYMLFDSATRTSHVITDLAKKEALYLTILSD